MLDSIPDPRAGLQRSQGAAHVVLTAAPGRTRLNRLWQQGSAKAQLPGHDMREVVFLNTSGGLTGGDRLDYRLDLGPGVRATGTTQAAERAYRSPAGTATAHVTHTVGAGGHLDWLPQETILYNGASLHRQTRITLAPGASCLLLESVVLGRHAMGETLTTLDFRDRREVWRGPTPALIDPLRLEDAALARAASPALLGGARAFATMALVAPGAEDALPATRAVLDEPGIEGAASGFDGICMIRLLAADGWPLRRQILRLMAVLRKDPPPRVWQM